MPLPNTRLIADGWAEHHRPTAQGQMVDECVITRPGGPGVWSDILGHTVYPAAVTVYSGPCRVQQIPRGRRGGEEILTVSPTQPLLHHYLIAVPADVTGARINDELAVTVCVADPSLLARTLRVADVLAGSLIWQRDLTCVDITPTGT